MGGDIVKWLAVAVLAALVSVAGPAFAAPGPPQAQEWWFDAWHVPALWSGGARGQGVTIAEIDTGVNAKLPELAGKVLPGTNYGTAGGDGRIDHAVELFGHGTAMASIMVANRGFMGITGLAPRARLLPVAVPLKGTNDRPKDGDDHLAEAIRWAANHGGKIISMSLGGERHRSQGQPCPTDEQDAINHAISGGAIVLASSGNSGQMGSPVEDPGVCLGVISVGAVDRRGTVPPFSSRHKYLTVTAPGVNIPSLARVPRSAYAGDGTSQATAITAATLALIWSKYPALSGQQVVAQMLATLDHRSGTQDPSYGYGIVNPYQAITMPLAAHAPNPVYAAVAPFLSAQLAKGQALPTPAPAATQPVPPGHFAVGQAPGVWTTRVWTAFAIGLLGAVALIVLAIVGTTRSRRHAALADNGSRGPRRGQVRDAPPAPTYRDDVGVVWHDLTAPRDEP
jgi:subtilisin family serine protease